MNKKKLELLFVMLFFLVLIATIINNNATTEKEHNSVNSDKPSNIDTSDYWFLTSPIFIDDTNPSYNWTKINADNDWCNGAGTWSNPYVIENLTIDCQGSDSGITIENSKAYFIIQNCTIYDSGRTSYEDAGITLVNASNGKIRNNDCSENNRYGIFLKNSSNNNTVSNNDVYESSHSISFIRNGIFLYNQCSYNTIENNTVYYCYDEGIYLQKNCNYNIIKDNIVNKSSGNGIFIEDNSMGNKIINNSLTDNDGKGLYISTYCEGNIVLNNTIYDNYDGIYVYDHCDDNIVRNNTIYNNRNHGIYFINGCENNTIINNTIYQNEVGIKVETSGTFCQYYTILGNILNNNLLYGIYLEAVMYVDIWENELYGCGFLIESTNILHHRSISFSTNNTVNGKPVYYCVEESGLDSSDFPNAGQIILINCNHTNLAKFNFSFCSIGIYIYRTSYGGSSGSYNHTISNLTIQGNTEGIYISLSQNVSISNITALRNDYGIFLYKCNDTKIDNCTFKENNYNGLTLSYCFYSNVTNSSAVYNKAKGLLLYGSEECDIINNTLSRNGEDGLEFNGGARNYVYRNDISYNNESGIYIWSSDSDYNLIANNTVSYNKEHGISIDYSCNNNDITNNSIFSNEMNGIYFYGYYAICNYNNLERNKVYKNGENGIFLNYNCKNNNITLNQIYNNEDHGIYVYYSSDSNIISNNIVYNNSGQGIYIYYDSNNCNISGNIIENKNCGIYIQDSANILMTENDLNLCGVLLSGILSQLNSHQIDDTNQVNQKPLYYYVDQDELGSSSFSNAGQIILINCNDTIISKVNVSYGSVGVSLYQCYNVTLQEINSTNNQIYGIYLKDSYNSTIVGNKVNYNIQNGIYLEDSYYINITGNQVGYNLQNGIYLNGDYMGSSLNSIIIEENNISRNYNGLQINSASNIITSDNIIENNKNLGIFLNYYCENITIYNNNISYNQNDGIRLVDIWNGINITQNRIIKNSQNGIYLQSASYSYIIGNLIENNTLKGLRLEQYSGGNLIYNNYFINNSINALDNRYEYADPNSWDNGSLGNYWDDYPGGDNNGDGIGDTPYYIPGTGGSRDNYPIWGEPLYEERDSSASEGKDKEPPSEIDLTPFILGGAIIGSMVALYYGLHVYSSKHPLRKGKIREEPLLKSPTEEAGTLKTKTTTVKASQTKRTEERSEYEKQKTNGIDSFDQYFIQEKLGIKFLKTDDLYDEILRNNSTIRKYLESDLSIDDIPDGEKLIATILDDEDLRKIDLIDLPANDKKIFLMELLSLNEKERKRLLDDLLKGIE